jgi:hypothetical protein
MPFLNAKPFSANFTLSGRPFQLPITRDDKQFFFKSVLALYCTKLSTPAAMRVRAAFLSPIRVKKRSSLMFPMPLSIL